MPKTDGKLDNKARLNKHKMKVQRSIDHKAIQESIYLKMLSNVVTGGKEPSVSADSLLFGIIKESVEQVQEED